MLSFGHVTRPEIAHAHARPRHASDRCTISVAFVLASLVVVVVPGPGVLDTVAVGLARGGRAAALAALGCTLGIVPHLAASLFGVAALLAARPVLLVLLRLVGAAYLVLLAVRLWRGTGPFALAAAPSIGPPLAIVRDGILLNLANPKLALFFLAFLPGIVVAEAPLLGQLLPLALVFMGLTLVVFLGDGALAGASWSHALARPRIATRLRQGFALGFVVVAVQLGVG